MKAIIFDLDNTLTDFMFFKKTACKKALMEMISKGLDMSFDEASKIFYDIYFREGLEDKEISQKFLMKVNGEVDYRLLAYGIIAYREARKITSYDGVENVLKFLKTKYKLAIVSDAPKLKAWIRLAHMKLDHYFDVILTSEDTGLLKPNPEVFLRVAREFGVEPSECMMVGDHPERDIGAKDVGMKTCFARYGSNFVSNVKWDYEIDNIKELGEIL